MKRHRDRARGLAIIGAMLAGLGGLVAIVSAYYAIDVVQHGYSRGFTDMTTVRATGIVAQYYWTSAIVSPTAAALLIAGAVGVFRRWRRAAELAGAGCVLIIGLRLFGVLGEPDIFGEPPDSYFYEVNVALLFFPAAVLALLWRPRVAAWHCRAPAALLLVWVLAPVGAAAAAYDALHAIRILTDTGYAATRLKTDYSHAALLPEFYWAAAAGQPLAAMALLAGTALLVAADRRGRAIMTAGCLLVIEIGLFGLHLEPGPNGTEPDSARVVWRMVMLAFPVATLAVLWSAPAPARKSLAAEAVARANAPDELTERPAV